MAMRFEDVGKMPIGKIAMTGAKEGGAVVAGLFGAGFLGKQVEGYVKPGIVATSSMTDKALAWAGNNVPKMAAWYLLKKEGGRYLGGLEDDFAKGVVASIVLDSAVRATNNGAPQSVLKIFNVDVLGGTPNNSNTQALIQANATLRNQLNQVMTKLASGVAVAPEGIGTKFSSMTKLASGVAVAPEGIGTKFSSMTNTETNREKRVGSMASEAEDHSNRRFSTMVTQTLDEKYGML